MAKLTLALLALVAAFVLVADASIVRTTVTTTEIEEDIPYGGSTTHQQCPSRQLQGKRFTNCKRYLTKSSRPYDYLRSAAADLNPTSQQLSECCEELRIIERVNPQCSCEALKKIVSEVTEQGTFGSQGHREMRPMLQKAKNIPEQCDLKVRSCRIEDQEY